MALSNKRFNALCDHIAPVLSNLSHRWEDEKEYEDFKDYQQSMEKHIEKFEGAEYRGLSQVPFKVTVLCDGQEVVSRVAGNRIIGEVIE